MARKTIMEVLAEGDGHCCVYGMLHADKFRKLSNIGLSDKLGVSVRTVSETRVLMKEGLIRCRGQEACTKK